MMKSVLIYGVLFWVLGCYKAAGQEAIGLYDLHYTLETDLSTPKGRNVAWDDVHVVSALQGIVNRDAPQLYVFFVDRDQLDIDKYWLNKYRRKGQWLYRKETVTYNTIEDLVSAYAGYIKGVVLYDERVPSTSNVASAVAGAEDLLPIRYDLDSESLYSRLVLGGPRLKVKRRLINEDGSVMFVGIQDKNMFNFTKSPLLFTKFSIPFISYAFLESTKLPFFAFHSIFENIFGIRLSKRSITL